MHGIKNTTVLSFSSPDGHTSYELKSVRGHGGRLAVYGSKPILDTDLAAEQRLLQVVSNSVLGVAR